jgi:3-methyladenine DNA glycosylase AlkD
MSIIETIERELKELASEERALSALRYFKTGEGQYGAGDKFIGVSVPNVRKVVNRHFNNIALPDVEKLLQNPIHEYRLAALLIMVAQYKKAKTDDAQKAIVDVFLANHQYINNWDLVDTSAPAILGAYLFNKPKNLLFDLAKSTDLWQQRTAIIATQYFIRKGRFDETIAIAKILLHHTHDLIHKAVGWMLREVAEKDFETTYQFIKSNYKNIPRTALRYAIEKFDPELRQQIMKGNF